MSEGNPDIQKIAEVVSGGDWRESEATVNEVNLYLQEGWKLLGVHQRGFLDDGQDHHGTVYILGHTNRNAPTPGEIPH